MLEGVWSAGGTVLSSFFLSFFVFFVFFCFVLLILTSSSISSSGAYWFCLSLSIFVVVSGSFVFVAFCCWFRVSTVAGFLTLSSLEGFGFFTAARFFTLSSSEGSSEGALAVGFFLLSSAGIFVLVFVVVSLFVIACSRSGVVGGVGWARLFFTTLASGVMAVEFAAVPFGVVGCSANVGFSANVNLVCRAAFGSVYLAGVTLVCFVFSPRLGDGLLPLAPLGLRRFELLVMVDCSRSFGTRVCVEVFSVLCRFCVG